MNAATKKPVRTTARKRRSVAGSKGGESKQKQPVIASNSVPSLSTARIVYLWSWGPIVRIDQLPCAARLIIGNGQPQQTQCWQFTRATNQIADLHWLKPKSNITTKCLRLST